MCNVIYANYTIYFSVQYSTQAQMKAVNPSWHRGGGGKTRWVAAQAQY